MSTRFASGRINNVYFTHDGTAGGDPTRCDVRGEARFSLAVARNSVVAADATVHSQAIDRGVRAQAFELNFPNLYESVLALIMAEIGAALEDDADVRVVVDSLNDFDVMATPVLADDEQPYTFESRSGGVLKNVTFRFLSTGPGAP